MIYKAVGKRVLDFSLALLGLLVLWPGMLLVALCIRLDSPGPAIFRQERLGKGQKPFTVLKFRTMVVGAYAMGGIATSSEDGRITRVGRFLRRTSLDELPQLLNILAGQMAIIGPRPILEEEVAPYRENAYYMRRYAVRQGLFCTVDIRYRAACSRETQFRMDAEYADKISFLSDAAVFFAVLKTVLSGENVYKEEKPSDE